MIDQLYINEGSFQRIHTNRDKTGIWKHVGMQENKEKMTNANWDKSQIKENKKKNDRIIGIYMVLKSRQIQTKKWWRSEISDNSRQFQTFWEKCNYSRQIQTAENPACAKIEWHINTNSKLFSIPKWKFP